MTLTNIEVAAPKTASSTEKGRLLEAFAEEFLRTQGYDVESQIRVTAAELDLLCKHKMTDDRLYVECKAHRKPLSANALKKLLGTISLKGYSGGWLLSAGPLGKDAKGFKEEWEQKPPSERSILQIHTPDRLIENFTQAKLIVSPPCSDRMEDVVPDVDFGDWILLITPLGRFWAAPTLASGVPDGVVVFEATTGNKVNDAALLRKIGRTDSTLSPLDFEFGSRSPSSTLPALAATAPTNVIEVEHGDSWADYRPARPKDFVGRAQAQKQVLRFLENVRIGESSTRVFAITGDSGMGKSSLIAKIRSRCMNRRHRGKFFVLAVDARAAQNATYVNAALVRALRESAGRGFGGSKPDRLEISDHSDPLSSQSIEKYLRTLESKDRVLCLILDQFEELYSKPELFPVFEEAQKLFLSAASASSSLVLGFAWRSDSTVYQDHPAYHMWHQLSDHRIEISLGPFSQAESERAVTVFEKELGQELRPEIRRQIIEICQGYPWLLKKLGIHIFEQLSSGAKQVDLVETLDVSSLFDRDLQKLTPAQKTCLRHIAKHAPADWYEVLDTWLFPSLCG